jgi:DNA adenine methylase
MAPTRPVLRYHGGKWLLAEWITAHFPAHEAYVEPFCGAASVLMRKVRAKHEVLNDRDDEVVNLFRILRDPMHSCRLAEALRLTPFSRTEFNDAYLPTACPIEQARRLIVRSFMGFASHAHNAESRTGFRSFIRETHAGPATDWANLPKHLEAFTERLRGVVVENRMATDLIPAQDHAGVLFYVDPPYPHSTRTFKARPTGQVYRHELSDDDHRALAVVLRGVAGMVVLSGYPCALYDEELFPDWHRVERRALADGARERTEVLWINAACWAALKRQKAQPALLEVSA